VGDDNLPRTFTFFIEVPGLVADHRTIEFEKLYTASQLVAYDENGLQKALESIPCCTTNADGTEQYLPINLVLIGDDYDLLRVLIRSGLLRPSAGWFFSGCAFYGFRAQRAQVVAFSHAL
jgi:hypothetical protein